MEKNNTALVSASVTLALLAIIVFLPSVKTIFTAAVSQAVVSIGLPPPDVTPPGGTVDNSVTPTPPVVENPVTPQPPVVIPVPPAPTVILPENPVASQPQNIPTQPDTTSVPVTVPTSSPQPAEQPQSVAPSVVAVSAADLAQQIPSFASVLSQVGVQPAQAASLSQYSLFMPGFSAISGSSVMQLTATSAEKLPSEQVFATSSNDTIDAATQLDFSDSHNVLQTFQVQENKPLRLFVKPNAGITSISGELLLSSSNVILKFNYQPLGNTGLYYADITTPAKGTYNVVTSLQYGANKTVIKNVILTDPDGYLYENINGKQSRVSGATVSLYYLNSNNQYILWPAAQYAQENPQTTDATGSYAFLVPAGTYYLSVESAGYKPYKTTPFPVIEGKDVNQNIAMQKVATPFTFNWQMVAIGILFVLVLLNFIQTWNQNRLMASYLKRKQK